MPRLTKIYTRKGDTGTTALGSGDRVPKDSARVSAYGDVDELNSCLGLALAGGLCPRLRQAIPKIQNELFNVGSDLCFTEADKQQFTIPTVQSRHIVDLENLIDELNAELGPLENFILPGGSLGAAHLHLARTICRRAERTIIALMREEAIGPFVLPYLNRLSDALFVMARYENMQSGVTEPLWDSRA